jgi:activator of HSP90 ATPase
MSAFTNFIFLSKNYFSKIHLKQNFMSYTLTQKVLFENTTAEILYSIYLDPEHHSAIIGGKHVEISNVEGTDYNANDGGHTGRNLQLIQDKLIVQSYLSSDWGKDEIVSTIILYFEQKDDDVLLHVTHANIPDDQANIIDAKWKDLYWTPMKAYIATMKQDA